MNLFVGSVEGTVSGGDLRPSTIRVIVDPGGADEATTRYVNELESADGQEFDVFSADVDIPAGVTEVKIRLASNDRNNTGKLCASMVWMTANLNVPSGFKPDPCIKIRKNLKDVDENTPDCKWYDSGSDVTIEIEVENCGNVDLTDVEVTDDTHSDCNETIGNLPAKKDGSTAHIYKYTCVVTNVTEEVTDKACVEGTYKTEVVEDCDQFKIKINPDPDIDIRKDNEGPDCTLIELGGDKTFKIVVTNTGNVDLTMVEVKDALSPECNYQYRVDPDDENSAWLTLAPGKSFSYECTVEGIEEGFDNVACVEGTYEPKTGDDVVVKDCDPSEVKIREQCCGVKGAPKPIALSFIYTGLNCDDDEADNNTQEDGKWDCREDGDGPSGALTVWICATDKEDRELLKSTEVGLGEVFSFSALKEDGSTVKFEADTYFTIKDKDGNVLQEVDVHTSCSQDLIVGDTFGALEFWGCEVNPPENNDKCCGEGVKVKPTQLTFCYTGDDCDATKNTQKDDSCTDKNGGPNKDDDVLICVTDKNDNDMFSEVVAVDGEFTITGTKTDKDGRPKFEGNTYITVKSADGKTVLQEITIHTSCSQDLIVDDQFGSLVFKDCSTTTPGGDKEKCCGKGTKVKPTALTFCYTGEGCDATSNTQTKDKCEDTGDGPNGATKVKICVTDKEDRDLFSGLVDIDSEFTVYAQKKDKKKKKKKKDGNAFKFEADMFVTIKSADGKTVLQKITIHSSCSQDLAIGDKFGALEFKDCDTGLQGGNNNGSAICMKGKKGKAVELTFTYTGEACTASVNDQGDKATCTDSNGGPAGEDGVTITITNKDGKELFSGTVNTTAPNNTITIEGKGNDGKFSTETYFKITKSGDTKQNGGFHTSCSKPLRIGDKYGALQLTGGEDEEGNKFD